MPAKKKLSDQLDEKALLNALRVMRKGDFSVRLPLDQTGMAGAIAEAFNGVAELNERMVNEFSRLRHSVLIEGNIEKKASLGSAGGSWSVCIDSVNSLVDALVQPISDVSHIIGAVVEGDLTVSMQLEMDERPIKGIFLQMAKTVNSMVTKLGAFASEVTRVAGEVGTEGRLGGQAEIKGLGGIWDDLNDNVNQMAVNLTDQVRNIAEVTTAVANGDLSKQITVEAKGEILELKNTINTMVGQLGSFASEVTRVAREVGSEGKLGGQATVKDVSGIWKELTDNVNQMADNLTGQVRNIAEVTTAVANGDLSRKITVEASGEILELKNTVNSMVDQLSSFASEVTRVARDVGTEGKLGGQAVVEGVAGIWNDLTNNVNLMASNLTDQVRNIAEVTTGVANGDLAKEITVEARGEILDLKDTINAMVGRLRAFASEVTRVAREVGVDGNLGGQATVEGVAGIWKDLTDNVNMMASNLTDQVRNIAEVTTSVANGDLSRKITVEASGEILALRNTMNTMVDQLGSFGSEVNRVAREVGTDGKLGGQAIVEGVAGIWKDLTDNVNLMANNLTDQVRNIAEVTTSVANGDLSRKITVEASGEIQELKDTINAMVDQLSNFASEVTRVAREVGTEGTLGGQAEVEGVAGIWKDLTDNVNQMAKNLTEQVRNIAEVTTAVANGDLSKQITVEAKGEILKLGTTINTMVDQLGSFADQVIKVARDVGTKGELGGQAKVEGVAGVWKDLTDNVNQMAKNLTDQVRNIAEVTTAVANGDLSKKITVEVSGEILQLGNTINIMVDQLSAFASEVTRVAREVGTEGELGGQAKVEGVGGVWKDLTDNVNQMANNLTGQVRNIAEVTTAVANGDLSRRITVEAKGEILELRNTINIMVDQLRSFAAEVTRVAREVGTDGKLGGQAFVEGVSGVWEALTDNVNQMANNLTDQVRNIAEVTTAVAIGDFSKKITVEASGEILQLGNTINTMVDRLSTFASEVTRVAREVGTEGKLGAQAKVVGVAGTWKELTDNVNTMAENLTEQVRGIATVVTAVANGDLKRKLTLEAKGEIAALADTINEMTDTLAIFADQVTSVAREVGVEGKLGGQATVPGAAGIWRELTDNVNELADNLTRQVRAIAEVATAVTKGDLTRSITAEAMGEVAQLRDNINEMIRNLRETSRINADQDWLNTNLARFTAMLQGQREVATVGKTILSELAPVVNAQHGIIYIADQTDEEVTLKLQATYAFKERKHLSNQFKAGEGLVGQCLFEKKRILLTEVPENYIQIRSGLGQAAPLNIVVLPVLFEDEVQAVIELASFNRFSEIALIFLEQLCENIGVMLNTISATMRTEELLKESQAMSEELQSQQDKLQETNRELEQKAVELGHQKESLERKNREVDQARKELELKAQELAITSKYKSEFLANMSHELRTPLNSLLILAQMLRENPDENLTPKQVEFAETIHASGADLLNLINDILDLSKIEAGVMGVEVRELILDDLRAELERAFSAVAEKKGIDFSAVLDPELPRSLHTDPKRLLQVLNNLLSNAFKFTDKGQVRLRIQPATGGWSRTNAVLNKAHNVIALSVRDTGIGIAEEKQQIIFESFQQVDGSTSRTHGGAGLGLTISREIARLLGGEISVESEPDKGSAFTLYLPLKYSPPRLGQTGPDDQSVAQPPKTESVPEPWAPAKEELVRPERPVGDDREEIQAGDKVLLIVEDDLRFAGSLVDIGRRQGFKTIVATRGEQAMALARQFKPDGITLDIMMPGMDGWKVLDRLKHDPNTRHIPVHIISVVEEEWQRGLRMGAVSYVTKPISKESLESELAKIKSFGELTPRKLLVVEGDEAQRKEMVQLTGDVGVETTAVGTGKEALHALEDERFECIVVGLDLPDTEGFQLIEKIKGLAPRVPVIVRIEEDLSPEDKARLTEMAETTILKEASSLERLLDETTLFLHQVIADLPEPKKRMLGRLREKDEVLSGKKVLLVDDDARNVFALVSVLERYKMEVLTAEDGKECLETLESAQNLDLVIMDMMMPVMDGYEATREIRKIDRFKELPIVALTAKAMKGDREKCIDAGASDYISKPVDTEQLISLLRVWLYAEVRSEE